MDRDKVLDRDRAQARVLDKVTVKARGNRGINKAGCWEPVKVMAAIQVTRQAMVRVGSRMAS